MHTQQFYGLETRFVYKRKVDLATSPLALYGKSIKSFQGNEQMCQGFIKGFGLGDLHT